MRQDDFIRSTLIKTAASDNDKCVAFASEVCDEVLRRYRAHEYTDLDHLLKEAIDTIREQTTLIDFLRIGGTISDFADRVNICYSTAREKLNSSDLANRDDSIRPYFYSLVKH